MDIGKSFTYMFDEDKWVEKLLIGGLLCLIPIVNFFAIGYALRAFRNVSDGKRPVLPEWNDWGNDWVKGFLSSAVAPFIYALPILLVMIPFGIISSATSYSIDMSYQTGGSVSGGLAGLGAVCSLAVTCLASLWGLLVGVVYPAATVQYGRTGRFASYFSFREIFRFIKDNLSDYIVAILLSIVASIVAGIVGSVACGVGLAFTTFWSYLVMAFLFGQIEGTAPVSAEPVTAAPNPPAPPAPNAPLEPLAPQGSTSYGDLETTKLDEHLTEDLGQEPPSES